MKVEYFVFSGTGNTLIIARAVGNRLSENGYEVNYHMMEKSNSFKIEDGSVIGLAFPIAFFSSYPVVLQFISSLPEGNGRKIFMTATMGGAAMGAEGKFRQMVISKGYIPVGSELFVMPGNYGNKIIPVDKNKKKVDRAVDKARYFADTLINGTAKWGKGIPIIPSIWYSLVANGKTLRFFYGKFPIKVNNEKCIKCMRCAENCPADAIKSDAEYPFIDSTLCQSCQRCVAFCPSHAISVHGKHSEQYRAMEFEEFR